MKRLGIMIVVVFVVIYVIFFRTDVSQYDYHYLIKSVISPDGQYKVDLYILGEVNEEGSFPVDNPQNETYDQYARVWYNPQIQSDGTIMWYDTNTKMVYFQKNCVEDEVTWLDNDTVLINGVEIDVQ